MLPSPQRLKPCSGVGWQTCAAARTDPLCQSTKEPRGGRGPEHLCVFNPGFKLRKYLGLLLGRQRPFWGAGSIPGNARERCQGTGDLPRMVKGLEPGEALIVPIGKQISPFSQHTGKPARLQRRKVGAWCLPCPFQPLLPQFPPPANEFNDAATSEGPCGWQGHEPGEEKST